jgi:signal transduction histidine kinase
MSKEVFEHLAEPFFSTRINEGGTGLGLYISSSIIKEHGGDLLFESEPGKGTKVNVCLPVAQATAAPTR